VRVLVIGGTRFIGPAVVGNLVGLGHAVTVFHRGNHCENIPAGVGQILAPRDPGASDDKYNLRPSADAFRRFRPDVVVHMRLFTRQDAETFLDVFRGLAGRAVVPSSMDVYLAFGRIRGTEPGPPQPTPLREDSELRHAPSIHGDSAEKMDVERVIRSDASLPATILRYPAVYGERDFQYRFYPWARRVLDKRPLFVLGRGEATFRFTHGYVHDVGLATALAVQNEQAAGRTYNVGEQTTPTLRERLEAFCDAAGHRAEIIEVPDERLPDGDGKPYHGQDWNLDTSRIRSELGYAEPTDDAEALGNTFQWQRDHPQAPEAMDAQSYDYDAEDALAAEFG
jgi:nucleoside-diphosphate-sugar epimerase